MLGMLTVSGHHDYKLPGVTPIDFVDNPMLNEYLNGIHYQDQFVSHVIDMFKELGLYENTVFVVTGDHGEGSASTASTSTTTPSTRRASGSRT
ncbi:sulfatase-like hydrolase/transferase [Tessaracoccus sp. HDW20]|uniref:sulfatase-like hydrolase/transferase n=1 Tax=Tessaracoccus coleopterorum TaxID=2714950 RepID=UPI0018D46906|nr:sulfatase-like hydrolase/transferase [Tessaracoccus coleopterorum]NHB83872.1 sulfatase-like hydrolase/transferase [Tessaracoccus coleopterorum]